MRLLEVFRVRKLQNPGKPVSRKTKIVWITAIVIVIVLGSFVFVRHRNVTKLDTNANDTLVNSLSKSNSLEDQRNLASAYLAQGKYADAEKVFKDVSQKSGAVNDYIGLLTICTTKPVSDKKACINEVITKIKPKAGSLPFYNAYMMAAQLDHAGYQKDSAIFYQRAYDTYDSANVDETIMTREQIKSRIATING